VPSIVVLVSDLMFSSRIREAAKALGTEVRSVRTPEALAEACHAERPTLVIADLDDTRVRALAAIATLRADAASGDVPVIGFISHVNGAGALAAQQAGCTRVLARSAFVNELPQILTGAA
jgi:CheY-like chemotaxis protein